jgi:hypothetical protein
MKFKQASQRRVQEFPGLTVEKSKWLMVPFSAAWALPPTQRGNDKLKVVSSSMHTMNFDAKCITVHGDVAL